MSKNDLDKKDLHEENLQEQAEKNETIKEENREEAVEGTDRETVQKPDAQEEEEKEAKDDLEGKYNELSDRFLRLVAEYDNFKKRTQKEKSDIYISATADVIEAILPVADTISRALEMDKDNQGIALIEKQLLDSLKSIGVEVIPAVGETFDPEFHNAVFHVEDENVAENTIVEEFARGYKYKNKVIRHSVVKVAN
ncbi:MAG: nucleotide exchange factor GrpE [Eubacteriales bacterium]|jgi:molecular chaperone GrpE|nr:nucleotide exchange factor GrpE [Eubacteriales bacterium]